MRACYGPWSCVCRIIIYSKFTCTSTAKALALCCAKKILLTSTLVFGQPQGTSTASMGAQRKLNPRASQHIVSQV